MKTSIWQDKIIEFEKTLSNRELFDEVINQAAGDDYDGGFTTHGDWEFRYLRDKLERRLADWLALTLTDHLRKTCQECGIGQYREASIMDDMDGVLHCDHCNHEIRRWER